MTPTSAATLDLDLRAHPMLLVRVTASWCGPCRAMAPILQQFALRHPEIAVRDLDFDTNPELVQKWGVRVVPTLLFFRQGVLANRAAGNPGSVAGIENVIDGAG